MQRALAGEWRGWSIHVEDHLEAAIHKPLATESLILEPALLKGFDHAAFEQAWAAFEAART